MDTIDHDDKLDAQREIIRGSLNEIANEVGMALRDAGIRFPVYLTVPNSGDALSSFATPLDPSADDWAAVSVIVTRIVSKILGDIELRNRHQECAMARASMSAAEVTAD